MHVIYTSKGMSKKFGVCVIYRKIRYFPCPNNWLFCTVSERKLC